MVATMNVYVYTGAGPSAADTDGLGPPNIRFKTADDATIDANNPLPIPSAGTNRSYWKTVTLYCETAPDTQIDNIKVYSDGTGFGTSLTLYVGDETTSTYDQATGTAGTSGDELVASHTEISAKTDFFTYTTDAVKSITITAQGDNLIELATEISDYVVFQLDCGTGASPGNLADETFTFRYDEI